MGHVFYATSSFVYHCVAIGEFKLELYLEILRVTLKNNRAPRLYCFKLFESFHSHWWIQTGVIVRTRPIWVKIDDFVSRVTLKFDGWHWKTTGHISYTTLSLCSISQPLVNSNWSYSPESNKLDQNRIFSRVTLKIWRMTLKNNWTLLLSSIRLFASFHHHIWIQTGFTVRKRLSWTLTCDIDLWPWPFASPLPGSLVKPPKNFMMIWWWEHSETSVTDGRTGRRTECTIHRAAWSQLKITHSLLTMMLSFSVS